MKTKSLPIIGALFLVFAMAVQSFVSYHRETENMQSYIESRMELAEKKFLFEVYDMYEATDEIIHFFPQYNPRNLAPLLSAVLGRFPNLYSCYVAFTPQSSPLPGRQFAPGALRREGEDSIVITDYADRVDYLSRDWYSGALQADDEGYWSLPYNDADHQYPVFTHSRILRNTHGQIIAVVGADYTLAWTHRLLDEFKPYPDALCQLYSTEGELVVQCGEAKAGTSMLTVERTLSPTSMRLLISVPRSHLLHAVWRVSLLTLLVLLLGIVIALLLIRRIWRDQRNYLRIETNHQLIERELHIASSIQQGILRHDPPDDHRLQLSATLIPMHEVGGDLYDYQLHGDDLYFIVGDVSGKGVPAAIFMSAAVILFRSAVRRLASPKEIVSEMNALLSANNPSLTFVTAFVGRLHIPSGQLLYCNAAHNPPLLINEKEEMRNGEYLPVKPNLPLGYNPSFPYVEQGLFLEHDQLLLLYTDGVTEARNPARQLFGTQRLLQAGHPPHPPPQRTLAALRPQHRQPTRTVAPPPRRPPPLLPLPGRRTTTAQKNRTRPRGSRRQHHLLRLPPRPTRPHPDDPPPLHSKLKTLNHPLRLRHPLQPPGGRGTGQTGDWRPPHRRTRTPPSPPNNSKRKPKLKTQKLPLLLPHP